MEKWTRWEPVEGMQGKFFIENFQVSEKGLNIRLRSQQENKKIEIVFVNSVDAYRCTNESWCFDVIAAVMNTYGDDFYHNWRFFKIAHSNYAKSLSLTSCGLSDDQDFNHFCIVGDDEMIDILATYDPEVKIIS